MGEAPERTEGVRRRDPVVMDAVVRECLPALLRGARAAGLAQDRAEDLVQSTFLVFFRRAEEFDGRARCLTWLYGIMLRKLAEDRRSVSREEPTDQIEAIMDARFGSDGQWLRPPGGPEWELEQGEIRRMLRECLETVPERQRLVFTLREVEGLTTEEICNLLEVSSNNLGVLLYRARNRLRECLEGKGLKGNSDAQV
jgi:RNA polymerase sigma-70 factor (ECF subfamily)